eukprot:Skav224409  [mRNA]  locus=scaffold657:102889:110153:+ [translate_table: standard]
MKVTSVCAVGISLFAAQVAGDSFEQNLQQQLEQLKAEVVAQREVIEELKVAPRHLEAEEKLSIAEKIANLEESSLGLGGALDSAWLCLCGALVMFMHAGFAMLETGCCRAKNASNVLMKNLVNVCCGTLGWWSLGWAFAYGDQHDNGFIGTDGFFGWNFYTRDASSGVITPVECTSDGRSLKVLSLNVSSFRAREDELLLAARKAQADVVLIQEYNVDKKRLPSLSWALRSQGWHVHAVPKPKPQGTERGGVAIAMCAVGGPGCPPLRVIAAYCRPGSDCGMFSALQEWMAGLHGQWVLAGVVHLCGGVAGLAGTFILGPRTGRFTNPEEFECHNLPLVVLGTFALWFGWYGFNPGSTLTMKSGADGALAAQVAMNTTLSAAAGGLTVFIVRYVITHKYDVGALCNGILGGLVSITAGCGSMESGSAVATGVIGGFVYQAASMLLQKLKIDDPVDAVPVHGFCGAWGVIAAGLFDWGRGVDTFHGWSGFGCMEHDEDSGKSGCRTGIGGPAIGAQFIMVLMIVLWSGTLSSIGFFVLKKTGLLRISEEVEEVGMDTHHHSPPKAYNMGEVSSPSKSTKSTEATV